MAVSAKKHKLECLLYTQYVNIFSKRNYKNKTAVASGPVCFSNE